MKQLIDSPENVVMEMLEGLVLTTPHLQRLDGFPDIKVVYNSNVDKTKVSIISGGGSGHEPAHAGYVGDGMLTAAVCGEVFASPSAEAVLAGIRTVTGPEGCLLITKNYTGDRLHFGIAAEQAKGDGLKVELLAVGEDVAIDKPGIAGRRGLAGTVLVHKVAGAAAARGHSLQEVAALAKYVAGSMGTLGVALTVCTLPGKETSDRLGEKEIEIGLGIHGEPGQNKVPHMGATELTKRLLRQITESSFLGGVKKDEPVVLLVNNLGTSTPMEMMVVANAALKELTETYKVRVERVFVGAFVTSLNMSGMSLTLLKLGGQQSDDAISKLPSIVELLDDPAGAPGWPGSSLCKLAPNSGAPAPVPGGRRSGSSPTVCRPEKPSEEALALERAIRGAAQSVVDNVRALDELDAKVGDGDCGSTVGLGASAILKALEAGHYPIDDAAATATAMATSVGHSMGGSSGALYDIFFSAGASSLKETGGCGARDWALALTAGAKAVSKYGGATVGCRTMLDALMPAAEAACAAVEQGKSSQEVAAAAASAAQEGAEKTKTMAASAGRASYVPTEVLRSVPDPGAKAVATWLEAMVSALNKAQVPGH